MRRKRKLLALSLALGVSVPSVVIVSPVKANAITYTVECYTNPYYPPIKSGSGTSITSASSVCFRNIANAVYNSSCVSGVVITGNNPTRAGRTGRIYKGESDQGWPWYCGTATDNRAVTSYIP